MKRWTWIIDPLDAVASRQIAATSLRTFMRLPVAQRASVILMDVLGCSLNEICKVMDCSLPAAKAALHRGRAQLREIADEPEDMPQQRLSDADRVRLGAYVAHFNARDFDAIRAMIADDVRLDLVSRTRMRGKAEVSSYFGNYAKVSDWRLVPGLVERHPAILVFDPNVPVRGRNISCCWTGSGARSRTSGISAMQLTLSMAPIIGSEPNSGREPVPNATIVASVTGIIVLAFPAICELWCRPPGHEPKVQSEAWGSCLPQTSDFAHKIPHRIMRRAG